MERGDRQGEDFRIDLRPLAKRAAGAGNASARRILSAAGLVPHRLLAGKGALDGAKVRDLRETFGLIFAPRASRVARPELA